MWSDLQRARYQNFVRVFALTLGLAGSVCGQTVSTGALTGVILDPSRAVLAGVILHLTKEDGPEATSSTSDENGRFGFLLLRPGTYELRASKIDFTSLTFQQ